MRETSFQLYAYHCFERNRRGYSKETVNVTVLSLPYSSLLMLFLSMIAAYCLDMGVELVEVAFQGPEKVCASFGSTPFICCATTTTGIRNTTLSFFRVIGILPLVKVQLC